MKIVAIGKYFPPFFGGVELMTELSARALSISHDVTVICHSNDSAGSKEELDGYKLVRCATQLTLYKQPVSLDMGREIQKARPDLIHFHAPNFWGAAMISLYAPKTPIIVTHHADVEGRPVIRTMLMPLYRRIVERAATIIVASRKTALMSPDLLGKFHNLSEIPLGVDERKFGIASSEIASIRASKHDRFGTDVLYGFVGRLVWYKGLPVLLEAFSHVRGARLVIVGDGPMKAKLVRLAQSLGIGDRVTFVGKVSESEKKRMMHEMDVLVLPSTHKTEAFGLVQVEAQLCGKPVITTDLPTGVSDVTVDGVTGRIVKAGDCISLASAMQQLADDEALREQFGAAGKRRALGLYTERHYMDRLRAEVETVLAGAR